MGEGFYGECFFNVGEIFEEDFFFIVFVYSDVYNGYLKKFFGFYVCEFL